MPEEKAYRLIRILNIRGKETRRIIWRGVGDGELFRLSYQYPKYWSSKEAYDLLVFCDSQDWTRDDDREAVKAGLGFVRYEFQYRPPGGNGKFEPTTDPRYLVCCVPDILMKEWHGRRPRCDHTIEPRVARYLMTYTNGSVLTDLRGFRKSNPKEACTV